VEMTKDNVVDLMMGFFKTKTITSALELGIFDALADGPISAEDVCRRKKIPESSGNRLLIALVGLGLLSKQDENFNLTQVAKQYLIGSSNEWLGWLARHIDTFLYPLWSETAQGIRNNKDQREEVFGDKRSWFEILYEKPNDVVDFQEFLGIFAKPFVDGMIKKFDFSPYKKFMDIGSGIGSFPLAVAEHNENLEISICELPQAADFVREKIDKTEFGKRIKIVEGDVIKGNIPKNEYDLIHLGWMLHDYNTKIQTEILSYIYDALPTGGTFIASETPLDNDETGPLFTSLLSINMLVSTDGGIESTVKQYIKRFEDVGFINVRTIEIPGPRTLFCGEKAKI